MLRVADPGAYSAPIIVCYQEHRVIVAACFPAQAGGDDPLDLVFPSDHIVQRIGEFKQGHRRIRSLLEQKLGRF